ncbi:hypothetical protein Pmani_023046 [Petrolisthes manimaculis]|uniref:Oplophorus-luciferin 2-monooxygenase non-catalytic subunit n=1 Tax=Petrolisthes manimaculis TaxID=1843537 RepID=A0AAE1PBW5_9EUCA|nr:hypothetical protein Pmani_023046 [Petrolisthes manimaculis]
MKTTELLVVLVSCLTLVLAAPGADLALQPMPKEWPCPVADDILPCVCTSDEYLDLFLVCTGVSTTQLDVAMGAIFPFTVFLELKILESNPTQSTLTELPEGIFRDLTFQRVIISGTGLRELSENVFSNSHSTLKLLNLNNNLLEDFTFESVRAYTLLETLILDDNSLSRLWHMESTSLQTLSVSGNHGLSFDATVFQNVTNLRTVNMARIDHVTIPQNLFQPLDKVTYIDLSSNRLDRLNEFAINPPNPTLRTLKLNQNSITEILPNAIQGLTTDATVQMSTNLINLLTQSQWESVFVQVPDGHIDLTGNILNCGCDMDWMFLATPEDKYLHILTDTTTCFDGTKVVFLDNMWFFYQCQQRHRE